jgi:hypothetical protein
MVSGFSQERPLIYAKIKLQSVRDRYVDKLYAEH